MSIFLEYWAVDIFLFIYLLAFLEISEMSVETFVKCTPTVGKVPQWDDATQSLLWVDINNGILFRWDTKTKKHETHKFGKNKFSVSADLRHTLILLILSSSIQSIV